MPAVELGAMRSLLDAMQHTSIECWTLSRMCQSDGERNDSSRVNWVDNQEQARYFSRSPIPYGAPYRDTRIHIGVYGFKPGALKRYVDTPPSVWSDCEDLNSWTGCRQVTASVYAR